VDVVGEHLLAVDLDDGQPLSIALLELRTAADIDLLQSEAELGPQAVERRARARAEVAAGSVVQDDRRPGQGYRPRVVVASATRCTASP